MNIEPLNLDERERVEDALYEAGLPVPLIGRAINIIMAYNPDVEESEAEAIVVKRELETMARDKVKYIRLDPVAVVCEEIVANMKVMYPAAYFSISLYTSDVTITHSKAVPGQLTELLRMLGKHGFRQRQEPNNHNDGKSRSHYLERGESERVDINVYWQEEATEDDECKLVQTGTKTINQPIYEMVCKDDPRYEELTR